MDILIRQKSFLGKKELPLELFTNGKLEYGSISHSFRLKKGEIGSPATLFYDPEHPGTGIWVNFVPHMIDRLQIHVSFPSTDADLEEAFSIAERCASVWKQRTASIGRRKILISDFPKELETCKKEALLQMVRAGDQPDACIHVPGVFQPVSFTGQELKTYGEAGDLHAFSEDFYSKQRVDVYFASPLIYRIRRGIQGIYVIHPDVPTVLPLTPSVFPALKEESLTEMEKQRQSFSVEFYAEDNEKPLGRMPYEKFADAVHLSDLEVFDSYHRIAEFDLDTIRRLSERSAAKDD
ncbi:MAG: DUF4299 family protein [Eubacteriales bacterium]|nr:DUF4299 family protein [Eubacteriales bacterium]